MEESYVETVNSSTVVLFHCTLPSELSREIPSLCHPGIPGKFPRQQQGQRSGWGLSSDEISSLDKLEWGFAERSVLMRAVYHSKYHSSVASVGFSLEVSLFI